MVAQNMVVPNSWPALPEIFVLAMACLILLWNVFTGRKKHAISEYVLTQATLVGAAVLSFYLYSFPTTVTFEGMFILDPLATLSKLSIYLTSFFAFLYARPYISHRDIAAGDYYILGLFTVLGMMILSSAYHFLTIFLGIELSSLPLYAMVAMRRSWKEGSEAAMKYFVMGALASGMLLYGMSMLYGATQSLHVAQIAQVISTLGHSQNLWLVFGLVFVVASLAFKLGAAPFHLWVPDIYQGAPTPVTLFISSAPKIAALVVTLRLLVGAMPGLEVEWQQLLMVIALVSIALGNIVAIVQNNLKRLLAYSAIAHMGYMSLGLLAGTSRGYSAALFYVIVYAIMAMGAFGVLVLMSKVGTEIEWFEDLRGLNARNPWLAFMVLLIIFSMAGIPPGVGFFAKLGVLEALINVGWIWIAVFALVFAIIGSYYYIRVIKMMYFDEPIETDPLLTSRDMTLAIGINGLLVLGLGLFPSSLIEVCRRAFGI